MGVAIRLRQLAAQPVPQEDRKLYLTAASALEGRAQVMANSLPQDAYDKNTEVDLHRPVDLTV